MKLKEIIASALPELHVPGSCARRMITGRGIAPAFSGTGLGVGVILAQSFSASIP